MAAFFHTSVQTPFKILSEETFSDFFSIGNVSTSFFFFSRAFYIFFSFRRAFQFFLFDADRQREGETCFVFACARPKKEGKNSLSSVAGLVSFPLDRTKLEIRAFVLSSRLSSAIGFRFHLHLLPLGLLHLLLQRLASLGGAEPAATRRLCLARAVRRVLAAAVRRRSANHETIFA